MINCERAVDLRPILVHQFTKHAGGVTDSVTWKSLLEDVPEFSLEIMDALLKQKATSTATSDDDLEILSEKKSKRSFLLDSYATMDL